MKRFFITIFFISIVMNLLFLNYMMFKGKFTSEKEATVATPVVTTKSSTPVPANYCPAGCVGLIKEATKESKAAPATTTIIQNSVPKESFITFGTGSSSSENWQDIGGAQAYIDRANYPGIKIATFEASIHVPTGNQTADVRLYNATDKHPVWFSEMHFDGGSTAKLLTSQPIKLDSGNKLYIVQIKTQLKYPANLDSARLRIVTY